MLLLCIGLVTHAQKFKPVTSLSFSDPVVKAKVKSLLPSLGNKLIILDFWSTGCYSCMQAFSRLDSLQQRFGDSIEIVLVSRESTDSINRFLVKHRKLVLPKLRMVTSDTLLRRVFPFDAVPFHVWIGRDTTILHQTSGINTNEEHISQTLKGNSLSLEKYNQISKVSSFFRDDELPLITYGSYLAHCQQAVRIVPPQDSINVDIFLECASIEQLYQYAYNESHFWGAWYNRVGRVIYEGRGFENFKRPAEGEHFAKWISEWSFTYHLRLASNKGLSGFAFMRNDLDRYFGLRSRVEKRETSCLVLVQKNEKSFPQSRGGADKFRYVESELDSSKNRYEVKNQSIRRFSQVLGQQIEDVYGLPFVSAIDSEARIDVSMVFPKEIPNDLELLRKLFWEIGFDIIKTSWPINVLVIGR